MSLFTPQYLAGHNCFVAFAAETGVITESSDGTEPAALPAVPAFSGAAFIGYTDVPEQQRGLHNELGYGIGSHAALYTKHGAVAPRLTIELRAGAMAILMAAVRDYTTSLLPPLCLWVGVPGVWTDVYRFCKINELEFELEESTVGAREVGARLQVEAIARQALGSALSPTVSAMTTLGAPLFWHDVLSFTVVENGGSASYDFRQALLGLRVTVQHNLERKGERPNWGDDEALSRTAYALLEHLQVIRGEMRLHDRLPEAYFTTAAASQDWGDIALIVSDTPAGGTGRIALTLHGCLPSNDVGEAVAASGEQTFAISFAASDFSLAATNAWSG